MRPRFLAKFHWLVYVSLALFVMLGGSFARSQLLAFSISDGLIGAVAGISFFALMVVVIWLCGRYDDGVGRGTCIHQG